MGMIQQEILEESTEEVKEETTTIEETKEE